MLEKIRHLFGGINLTWTKVILAAIAAGVFTALMCILPAAQDTSLHDPAVYLDAWILCGILIIMNSRSPLDSGLKCFVFFLISQPLIYLLQVPFSEMGWGLFGYYKYWFILTLLTFPMGYIGYYMKKDRWWGLLILAPMLFLLAYQAPVHLAAAGYWFPRHLLSGIFCIATIFLYVIGIFRDKKIVRAGLGLAVILTAVSLVLLLRNPHIYSTDILVNHGSQEAVFDDSYQVTLEPELGKVQIQYEESLEDYLVHADFRKAGKARLILESPEGEKQMFDIDVGDYTFDVTKAEE